MLFDVVIGGVRIKAICNCLTKEKVFRANQWMGYNIYKKKLNNENSGTVSLLTVYWLRVLFVVSMWF